MAVAPIRQYRYWLAKRCARSDFVLRGLFFEISVIEVTTTHAYPLKLPDTVYVVCIPLISYDRRKLLLLGRH